MRKNLDIRKLYNKGYGNIFLIGRNLILEEDKNTGDIYLRYFDTWEHFFYHSVKITSEKQLKEILKKEINSDIKHLQWLKKKLKL